MLTWQDGLGQTASEGQLDAVVPKHHEAHRSAIFVQQGVYTRQGAWQTYERELEVGLGVRGVVMDGLEVLDGADAGLAVQEVVHLHVQAGQAGAHTVAVVPATKLPPVRCSAQHILLMHHSWLKPWPHHITFPCKG